MPASKEIKHALNFTDMDLEQNRAGQMSKAQKKRARRAMRFSVPMIVLVILVFAIFVGQVVTSIQDTTRLIPKLLNAVVLLFLLSGIAFLINFLKVMFLNWKDWENFDNRVLSDTGTVWITREQHRLKLLRTLQIGVDGETYSVPDAIFKLLEEGQVYTVYYREGTIGILSMERVDTDTSKREIKDDLKYLEVKQADLKAKNDGK